MTNQEIAAVLGRVADLLELQGANAFRVRAYRNAGRTIENLSESLASMLEDGVDLTKLPGVGGDLAKKLETLIDTGSLPMLEELLAEIPEGLVAMLRVPGLGPKKAAAIHKALGVASLDELRAACEEHKVRDLKGFGAKTEEKILKGIDLAEQVEDRMLWAQAEAIAEGIINDLRTNCPSIERIEAAGSYRRRRDTVGDLDLLVVSNDADEVMDRFHEAANVDEVLGRGETKMSVRQYGTHFQIDLRVVPSESFGAALQYFTGSQAHNVELRKRAKKRGLKINEYGVFRGEERIAGATEDEVYATLDLPCFPPELREDRWEFDWADGDGLPRLIELSDMRGDLHMHSTWTDGRASIEEMALAAKKRGLKYIAITDHSQRVSMVGGLDEDDLLRAWEEVDEVNDRLREITVLKGVEVDILERGGLDIRDDVLAQADWVVASVHFGQQQPRDQITKRIVDALHSPHVCAIGHPTGRLLGERAAYDVDMEAVMAAARDNGKFLELNASPFRLDLNDVACGAARAIGVPVVISTDAHYPDGLDAMRFGIQQARRGGLGPEHVVNARSLADFKKLVAAARS